MDENDSHDTMLKFDLISIQFALHYAFQTENKLLNLISTLKICTQPGSILLISCVRDDYIYDRMSREGKIVGNTDKVLGFEMYNTNNVNNNNGNNNNTNNNNNNNSSSKDEAFNNTSNNSSSSNSSSNSAKKSKPDRVIGFENSLHSLRFKFNIWNKISTLHTKYRKEKSENERLRLKENASKEEEGNSQQQQQNLNQASQQEKVLALIGIPYVYFQQDSVNHIEEYMISFEHLCKMLEVHVNMKKIFDQPFDQLVDKYSSIRRFEGAFTKRKLHERKPTKDELQVISMYRMCMFERL